MTFSQRRNCEGMLRRDSLKLGLGGLIAGGLAGSLRAAASEQQKVKREADACILIWLDGGPSHYETFDPKPEAPVEIRGDFRAISTKTPGMQFSQLMTAMAEESNELAVVRSIKHNQGNHGAGNHYMMTGAPPRIPVGCGAYVSFHPSLGSVVAKRAWSRQHGLRLPNYVTLSELRPPGPHAARVLRTGASARESSPVLPSLFVPGFPKSATTFLYECLGTAFAPPHVCGSGGAAHWATCRRRFLLSLLLFSS